MTKFHALNQRRLAAARAGNMYEVRRQNKNGQLSKMKGDPQFDHFADLDMAEVRRDALMRMNPGTTYQVIYLGCDGYAKELRLAPTKLSPTPCAKKMMTAETAARIESLKQR